MMLNERHSFITTGISREAFQDSAVRATKEDTELRWWLHAHPHDPFGTVQCNDRCQLVHKGNVEFVVTQTDVANSSDAP